VLVSAGGFQSVKKASNRQNASFGDWRLSAEIIELKDDKGSKQ
jgi:hypothetical protein